MDMQMRTMMHGTGGHWGAPYVRSWHGEGTRLVLWHLWPMIGFAWLLFMLGMMMGLKTGAMKTQMGMGGMHGTEGPHGMGGMMPPWKARMMGQPCGPGRGAGMRGHHHHGEGSGPCTDPGCAETGETSSPTAAI